jgi:hypothetical protein
MGLPPFSLGLISTANWAMKGNTMNTRSLGIFSALILLGGCGDGISDHNGYGTDGSASGNYFAVVSFYNDGKKEHKELGAFKLDQCRSIAMSEYNAINATNPNRAFDWFCKNTHSGRIDR